MKVDCVDFNRYGMAIETRRKLKKVTNSFSAFADLYIHENDIPGFVTSVTATDSGYRYGIMFAYTTSQKATTVKSTMRYPRIEAIFQPSQSNRG